MFKRLKGFLFKHRFTVFFTVFLLVFSMLSFYRAVQTGDVYVLKESALTQWVFRFLRIALYVALSLIIKIKAKPQTRTYLLRLLIVGVLIYELFIVFNLPKYLASLMGG